MKEYVHKLERISLVNWYLFNNDDIHVDGESIMLTGRNGSGKSTILDAIQTVFAGADENRLMFNAASSDGKRSGRTIRSYALGEVAEAADGQSIVEPRSVSNTYVSLVFKDRQERYYSFGCAFYARKDKNHVEKYFYLIKGYDLAAIDYMRDEHSVLPFKDFEKRLSGLDGRAVVCSTSTEFRAKTCELMSAAGSGGAISPDVLFRAISQGLKFKPHKDVTEFTRNHILPKRDIDVLRIENDYRNYKDIQLEIEMAKERLEMLKQVIACFETYKSKSVRGISFEWSSAEAALCLADDEHEKKSEDLERLKEQKLIQDQELLDLKESEEEKELARDNALTAKNNSDLSSQIKILNQQLLNSSEKQQQQMDIINEARSSLVKIESLELGLIDDDHSKSLINAALLELSKQTNFEAEDMTSQWPRDQSNLADTYNVLDQFSSPLPDIKEILDELYRRQKSIEDETTNLTDIHRKLSQGKASLTDETLAMIQLFKNQEINAVPICDLAEIRDPDWQKGVERFLGVWNREALLIVDEYGKAAGSDIIDLALTIYRKEKKKSPRLRAVKVINPEKINTPRDVPAIGTAAELIQSENPIVKNYLQGLLYKVELVHSEQELRQAKRAITPDGMVSSNGTISGGNRIDFLLFGQKARKDQAEELHRRLTKILEEAQDVTTRHGNYREAYTLLNDNIKKLQESKEKTFAGFAELTKLNAKIGKLDGEIKDLSENSEYADLEARFIKADEIYKEHLKTVEMLTKSIGSTEKAIEQICGLLPELKHQIEAAASVRKSLEDKDLFDTDLASKTFEDLSEKYGEDYKVLSSEADIKSSERFKSARVAREDGSKKLVELINKHDLENKDELVNLHPLHALIRLQEYANIIESSEITMHEEDAKQAREMMLQHFRSEVSSKLKDNIFSLQDTFRTLNLSLKDLYFNNSQYKFTYHMVSIDSLREVHEYVMLPDDIDTSGGLFDDTKDHPGLKVIEEVITDGRLSEIADYRNFYSYDIITTDMETGVKRNFSELLSVGSGGEQQSPFYVALGASFMSAYKIQKYGNQGVNGGAALAIFDEAMSKMDGVNTAAALKFFQSLGLQVILAAPPEASIKIAPYIDKTITVIRSGTTVFLDEHKYTNESLDLLESDNPMIHPELADKYIPGVKEELGVE